MEGVIKCDNCGAENNFRHHTIDIIDFIECEKERICSDCNELMDYWAYGVWESESKM